MGFESGLVARQVGDVDWELVEPLMYRGNTELFKVPIETKTDFATFGEVFPGSATKMPTGSSDGPWPN
jgi:hypothetical protein